MTTFVQRPVSAATPVGTAGLSRIVRSVTDAAAVLANSFSFAREMQSAHTPAARRAVLDRFAA